ncbi:MAG: 16S rRNA (cytidine(1402)-2'-O)-methyltransferase [Saprospiraceae bacterium]|nr:16S rRNA (cytidine(1402)-2'-O)-methyltransferase [Saprospiraceae bacterium]
MLRQEGILYIVPTPIGNLTDITLRAIEILKTVDLILAEDTRTSGILLKKYDIQTSLRSYHTFNEHKQVDFIKELLYAGNNIALVSDAGTPGVSDPGYLLIRALVTCGIRVSCLPGPTAFVPALVMSGLPSDKFYFEGFLPHKKGRQTRLKFLAELNHTFILYESPFRLAKCIEELIEYMGSERLACVVREISKVFEQAVTASLGELSVEIQQGKLLPKGEIVIIVDGKAEEKSAKPKRS